MSFNYNNNNSVIVPNNTTNCVSYSKPLNVVKDLALFYNLLWGIGLRCCNRYN
jgi:hypothetical protein